MKPIIQILYVEDNPFDRDLVKDILEKETTGFKVKTVSSKQEFLQCAGQLQDFDLVLTDLNILGYKGIEVLKVINKTHPDTPVIIVTGTGSEQMAVEAMKLGAADYVIKSPQHIQRLPQTIQSILEKHQLRVQQKTAAEELQKSEEKYRLVVENAGDAIVVVQDNFLKFVNPKAMEITGYTEREMLSKPFTDFIHPQDKEMVVNRHQQRLKGESQPTVYTFRILNLDNNTKWVELRAVLINWEGRPATLNFLSDITERKLAEAEKEKLQAQLLQSQKLEAIGTLAGGVAHDFNNILTVITGFTDLAFLKIDESDPLYRNFQQIRTEAGRAADLTRQLLAFSRRQPMEFVTLNLNETIERILKMLKRLIGEDITIVTELAPDLLNIKGDVGNIEQVIMNLAVNARDAMPDGGRLLLQTKNIEVDKHYSQLNPEAKPGRYVCLEIEDNGIGMDEETKAQIFDPFFTTKPVGEGTGLGLSVVYGIIKQHGGWINVYSEPNKGTTFKIYFPATTSKTGVKVKKKIAISELQGQGERILLVEDEKVVRDFAVSALTMHGYQVVAAAKAQEALTILKQESGNFELVFSDIVLPDLNGIELAEQLLAQNANLKILLSTGYADKKARWDIVSEKGFQFIHKPYDLTQLLTKVKEVLRSKSKSTHRSKG